MIAVRAAARALLDRIAPGAVILLYHRVTSLDFDPQLLVVNPSNFAAQLDYLQRAATVVPLVDLPDAIRRRRKGRGLVAITFDDGYADNLQEAKPQLARRGMPATVFVASGYTASGREFWWDELERIFLRPGTLPRRLELSIGSWEVEPAEYGGSHPEWTVEQRHDPTPRHALYRALFNALFRMSVAERERILDALRAWASLPGAARNTHRPMNAAEVRELASDGIAVGAHTVAHPRLSALAGAEQQSEIENSRRELERVTGAPVRAFAYPFGGRADYTRASVDAARSRFDLACSNFAGTVRANTARFELPRFLVRDWTAGELESRIGRLLA